MTAPEWVLLARIVRPQGRRGEVLAELFTDFPEEFSRRKRICLRAPDGSAMREITITSHWAHKGRIVLKFAEVDSMNAAQELRGHEVVVPLAERMPLSGDAVYVSDLLGMHIIDIRDSGADAGEIIDVEPEGSGPAMLVVRAADGVEFLIPFVRAYLKKIDTVTGQLEMDLPDGLMRAQRPD